jgi:1,2-diacylglycerol 3-alpha-glucosyltransferase
MPMRILMISDVYFPRVNGVSTSIQSFANELILQGHELTLITPDYGKNTEENFNIIRVPSRRVVVDPEDRMMKMQWMLEQAGELTGYDLIHIQTPFVAHYLGLKLARRLKLPVIETYHTYFEEYLYNYVPYLPKGLLRFAARHFSSSQCNSVDRVIVPSPPIENALRDYGVETDISVIPTGLNLPLFNAGDGAHFRQKHGIDANRPVALYVGRIAHEKNIRFLFDAMKQAMEQLPEMLFIVAGEGPAEKWLYRKVDKSSLKDNVMFIGYMDRNTELLDCYRAADLFVFASRTETQGLVLLEAMAIGTPVVSTAVLGTKSILSDGNGALIAKENHNDFSSKVVHLLKDIHARDKLARSGQEYVKNWSISATSEKLLEQYRALITESSNQEWAFESE